MKIAGKHFLDSQTLAKALYALGMIKPGQGNSFVIDFPAVATAEVGEDIPGRIKRGWDFGLTPACVFTQMLPEGRWIVFEEICGEDPGISTFADCVLQRSAQRFSGYRIHVS
jgi:hypothetical protein